MVRMKDVMFYDVRHKTLEYHLENLARHRRNGSGSIGRNERRIFPGLENWNDNSRQPAFRDCAENPQGIKDVEKLHLVGGGEEFENFSRDPIFTW
ncbi:hypothetical protein AVEN_175354-1 [Araneus ventricosus]|uniref:Uncharacterized protein n=1 Tax=Araneus ventricosus TaxID=182803 RepID=A0A4Y2HZ00_ARAVE|nr:hypothetical protein AVEN_209268-1 [Araneus ventricosus]GBM70671.1 hypothetical protein AVEN_175354-1 [Araneus ventricosus]